MFFYVCKAFDTVPHLPTLQTMKKLGFKKYLLHWIRSYHRNKTQFVVVDGCTSLILPVTSGLTQGSVLGPLLFIFYINDVTSFITKGSKINLFADDIVVYPVIKSSLDFNHLQQDINSVSSSI